MKKAILFLLIFALVFSSSCAREQNEEKEDESSMNIVTTPLPNEDTTDKLTVCIPDIENYTAYDLHTGYSSDEDISTPTVQLIKSTKELAAYWDTRETDDTSIFEPHPFDEEFFEENYLVVIYMFAHTGSLSRRVLNVCFNGLKEIDVYIEEHCPQIFTDDCSGWTHFIELGREYEVESAEKVNIIIKELASFSFKGDMLVFQAEDLKLKTDGFINTESIEIDTQEDAVQRAYREIDRTYVAHEAAYDKYEEIWRVRFNLYVEEELELISRDCITVYMTKDGITKAIYNAAPSEG